MERTPKSGQQAPIVAELGRPETPEEAAARRAASSRRYRESKTSINLVVALLASLAIVLVIVVIVVRPSPPPAEPVDYSYVAAQVQPGYDETIADPALPSDWRANSARITSGRDGVAEWYIGFVTPAQDFVALTQGIDANPTWLAAKLDGGLATGTATIDGVVWDIYDRREAEDIGNLAYAMTAVVESGTIVLHGTAGDDEFRTVAAAVGASVSSGAPTDTPTPSNDAEEAP